MKKIHKYIMCLVAAAAVFFMVFSLFQVLALPAVAVNEGNYSINIKYGHDISEALEIDYPPEISTDTEKLNAVYSILEQMRLEISRVGSIARSDWSKYQDAWNLYRDISNKLQLPVLKEQLRLRHEVIYSKYPDWKKMPIDERTKILASMADEKSENKQILTSASCNKLNELKEIDIDHLPDIKLLDPLEDWTTYDKNEAGVLTVAANTLTIADMVRGSGCYVSKDFGADHFGLTWSHLIENDCSELGKETEYGIYSISSGVYSYWGASYAAWICWTYSGGRRVYIAMEDTETSDGDITGADAVNFDTRYYYSADRSAAGFIVVIDDNSDFSSPVDTLIVDQGVDSFRYAGNAWTRAGGNTNQTSGHIYDFDLQEAAAEPSLANTPSNRAFGYLWINSVYWSNTGNSSGFSGNLTDSEAYFEITNDGSVPIDVAAKCSNFNGGVSCNLTFETPGLDEIRFSLFKEGDNTSENLTLSTEDQLFISSLASSASISWEAKLETGSWSDKDLKTATVVLTASES